MRTAGAVITTDQEGWLLEFQPKTEAATTLERFTETARAYLAELDQELHASRTKVARLEEALDQERRLAFDLNRRCDQIAELLVPITGRTTRPVAAPVGDDARTRLIGRLEALMFDGEWRRPTDAANALGLLPTEKAMRSVVRDRLRSARYEHRGPRRQHEYRLKPITNANGA